MERRSNAAVLPPRAAKLNVSMASEDRAATESSPADVSLGRVFERLPTGIAVFDPALAVAENRAGSIDLLFTDIVMPGMSGTELADQFNKRWPGTSVVYTTGYTDDETLRRHPIDRQHLIEKPFVPNDLLRAVRAALDATVG